MDSSGTVSGIGWLCRHCFVQVGWVCWCAARYAVRTKYFTPPIRRSTSFQSVWFIRVDSSQEVQFYHISRRLYSWIMRKKGKSIGTISQVGKDRKGNQLVSQRQTAGRNFKPLLYLTADISRLASTFWWSQTPKQRVFDAPLLLRL